MKYRKKKLSPELKEKLRVRLDSLIKYDTHYTLDQLKTFYLISLLRLVKVTEFYKYKKPSLRLLSSIIPIRTNLVMQKYTSYTRVKTF